MEKEKFLKNFSEQFEETDSSEITMQTEFLDIDEWDSLVALSVIAMVDDEYGIKITGDDIRNSKTVEDIYKIVQSKV